jgi:hypothetical protein
MSDSSFKENGGQFPSNREILQQIGQFKDAMPFVQIIKDRVDNAGGGFEEESEFDQQAVLAGINGYLLSTLQLEKLYYVDTSAEGVPEEIKKSISPGSPIIVYYSSQE